MRKMPRESAAGRLKNAIAEVVKFMNKNIGFDGLRASAKKIIPLLAVFWSVYCVTSSDTYLDMRR
jgi:hypothetical protein